VESISAGDDAYGSVSGCRVHDIATTRPSMRARPTPSYRRYKLSPRNPENRANEGREWLNTDYSRRGLTYKLGAVADPFLMAVSPAYRATAGPQTAIDLRFPPGAAAVRARAMAFLNRTARISAAVVYFHVVLSTNCSSAAYDFTAAGKQNERRNRLFISR